MRLKGARVGMFTVMLGGFLLFGCSPTTFTLSAIPNDGYPHYAKTTNCTGDHVSNPEKLGTTQPQMLNLCKGNSGTTSWFAAVYSGLTPVCYYGSQSRPYKVSNPQPQSQSFPCTLSTGAYKGYIYYWVGSSQMMTHLDQYFTVP
jgi:hypothetical protein